MMCQAAHHLLVGLTQDPAALHLLHDLTDYHTAVEDLHQRCLVRLAAAQGQQPHGAHHWDEPVAVQPVPAMQYVSVMSEGLWYCSSLNAHDVLGTVSVLCTRAQTHNVG